MFSALVDDASIASFQRDLNNLGDWATRWDMSFNTDKCSIIYFGRSPLIDITNIHYTLCGKLLKVDDNIKYLGIHITNNFKWETHINTTVSKGWRLLGLIKSSLWNAPVKVKRIAYLTLCRPLVEFASEVWDPHLKKDTYTIEM